MYNNTKLTQNQMLEAHKFKSEHLKKSGKDCDFIITYSFDRGSALSYIKYNN